MTKAVLDASALLALLGNEPGADRVARRLSDCVISAVNLAEVFSKTVQYSQSLDAVAAQIRRLQIPTVGFDESLALRAGQLHASARGGGLSLADCACLALGAEIGATVVTADRKWSKLGLAADIEQIRGDDGV